MRQLGPGDGARLISRQGQAHEGCVGLARGELDIAVPEPPVRIVADRVASDIDDQGGPLQRQVLARAGRLGEVEGAGDRFQPTAAPDGVKAPLGEPGLELVARIVIWRRLALGPQDHAQKFTLAGRIPGPVHIDAKAIAETNLGLDVGGLLPFPAIGRRHIEDVGSRRPRRTRHADQQRIAGAGEVEARLGEEFLEARSGDGAVAHAPMLGVAKLVNGGRHLEGAGNALQRIERRGEPQHVDQRHIDGDIALIVAVGRDHAAVKALKLDGLHMVRGRLGGGAGLVEIVQILGPARGQVDPRAALAVDLEPAEQHGVM